MAILPMALSALYLAVLGLQSMIVMGSLAITPTPVPFIDAGTGEACSFHPLVLSCLAHFLTIAFVAAVSCRNTR